MDTETQEQTEQVETQPNRFIQIAKKIINAIMGTNFEVSVKNDKIEGSISRNDKDFLMDIAQDGNKTNIAYQDSKLKVSHEMSGKTDSNGDDTKIS
jgi:hypothetical protein